MSISNELDSIDYAFFFLFSSSHFLSRSRRENWRRRWNVLKSSSCYYHPHHRAAESNSLRLGGISKKMCNLELDIVVNARESSNSDAMEFWSLFFPIESLKMCASRRRCRMRNETLKMHFPRVRDRRPYGNHQNISEHAENSVQCATLFSVQCAILNMFTWMEHSQDVVWWCNVLHISSRPNDNIAKSIPVLQKRIKMHEKFISQQMWRENIKFDDDYA